MVLAVKAKNVKMKQIAYPSALSAILGITEPAVFGVTLRLGRPFIMSMTAGGEIQAGTELIRFTKKVSI